MKKSELFFYIAMLAVAAIALLLEGWVVRYVYLNYNLFKTILTILMVICGDSFALSLWFI